MNGECDGSVGQVVDAFEIRNGAGDADEFELGAIGPFVVKACLVDGVELGLGGAAVLEDEFGRGVAVQIASVVAFVLDDAGSGCTVTNGFRVFAWRLFLDTGTLEAHDEIEPVVQWTRSFQLVVADLVGATTAVALTGTMVATRARIGRRDQDEACWIADGLFDAGDLDFPALHRLPQHIECLSGEFTEFIKEKYASICE